MAELGSVTLRLWLPVCLYWEIRLCWIKGKLGFARVLGSDLGTCESQLYSLFCVQLHFGERAL